MKLGGACFLAVPALLWPAVGAASPAAPAGPLACDYVKSDKLIRCHVQQDDVSVTGATVNDGKCRSPLQVFEDNKLMMKRNFGVDMDGVRSFVRTYRKGDDFSLNVDKGCAVHKFSLRTKDAEFTFDAPTQ